MSFIGMFFNKSFTFLVSDLTVLQSWFLREVNVVFFSDMILLMVSTLVFFPLESVFAFVCLLCVIHCHVVSAFPVFIVSVTVIIIIIIITILLFASFFYTSIS